MPIYEYKCRECGHKLEVLQSMSDEPLTDCPECKSATLGKCMSTPSFQLKGGGWYVTDFKDNNKKPENKTEGSKSKND